MSKYQVSIIIAASNGIEVEADSPEEAAEIAYRHDKAFPMLCHHCAREVEIGDTYNVIVYDESGMNELYNDGEPTA